MESRFRLRVSQWAAYRVQYLGFVTRSFKPTHHHSRSKFTFLEEAHAPNSSSMSSQTHPINITLLPIFPLKIKSFWIPSNYSKKLLIHLSFVPLQFPFSNWKWIPWNCTPSQSLASCSWHFCDSIMHSPWLLLLHPRVQPAMVITNSTDLLFWETNFHAWFLGFIRLVILNSFLFLFDAGAAIDQGIAYFLLLLALAITYLFHWFIYLNFVSLNRIIIINSLCTIS